MYTSNYRRYKRKKNRNTAKAVMMFALLFLIGYGIAFLINNETIIINKTGLQIKWGKSEDVYEGLVLPDDYEVQEDTEEALVEKPVNAYYFDSTKGQDEAYISEIIEKYKNEEITAVVMPLKLQTGFINYKSSLSYVNLETGYDLEEALNMLKENNVYVIAEMYTYTDDKFIIQYRESAIMTHNDYVFLDISKKRTINPYNEYGNEYIKDLLLEVEALGVDEIMLAGYHFTEAGLMTAVKYTVSDITKEEILVQNVQMYNEHLSVPLSIRLSKSALLEENYTFEDVEELSKVVKTVYIPVLNDEDLEKAKELNIENKGIIAQGYKLEDYNNIEY